jgi:hypothetical protein
MKSVKLSLNGLRRLIREAADEAEQLKIARPLVKEMFEEHVFNRSKRKEAGFPGSGFYLFNRNFMLVTSAMDKIFDSKAAEGEHLTAQALGQAVVEYLENECDALTPEEAEKERENITATNQKQGKLKGGPNDPGRLAPILSPSYDPAVIPLVDAWVKKNVNKYSEFDDADGRRKPKGQKGIPSDAYELEDERASGGGTPRRFKSRD